ncbi:MAG: YkvA family protein [Desulfobulbaceae bacterium]
MSGENRGNPLWMAWNMVQRAVAVFLSRKTPWYVKVVLGAGLLYVVSPYDLIPEWIPVFGVMDDLALAALLIAWASGYHEK